MQISVLKRRSDFLKVTKKGCKIVCRPFILFILENADKSNVSYGLIVSAKLGGAVIRNRIKRRLKHLLYNVLPTVELEGISLCILAKKQSYYLKFNILQKEIRSGFYKYLAKDL